MSRHLAACESRRKVWAELATEPGAAGQRRETQLFHLQVRDAWGGHYWLNLEVVGSAPLDTLDGYLRGIWLECCGHASRFSVGGWRAEAISMSRKVHQVFRPGVELTHIYDFGTESVTLIRAVDQRTGRPTTQWPIALMARNIPPLMECQECGSAASLFCMECSIEHNQPGTLCVEHGAVHPHEQYSYLSPIANSPRVGLCGYDGPAEPPY
jgi:hypothetical protein